jgi:hypothetical protein
VTVGNWCTHGYNPGKFNFGANNMPKNSTAKKSAQQYKKLYKELRPFVDFKIDLRQKMSSADKAKITRYTKELKRLTAGKPYDVQIYRARDKSKLKKVQELAGQDTKLKGFKVAFVPKTSDYQQVRFNKKGEATIKTRFVDSAFIPLDAHILATDSAIDYINDLVQNRDEKTFGIQAGDYEITGTFSKTKIASAVNKLCEQYSNPYSFDNQAHLDSYRNAKRDSQIRKDRAARKRDKNKRIKVYYWYDRKAETVLLTKTDTPPNANCEPITKREYERFLNIGEI